MSKSLGNFFSVRELLDQGYAGEVIRFVYLSTHYSKPMDWTDKKAKEAEATLRKWADSLVGVNPLPNPPIQILEAISNDLNTALAIKEMHAFAKCGDKQALKASLDFLGFENIVSERIAADLEESVEAIELVNQLIDSLINARNSKDWGKADQIKNALIDSGVTVQITKDGVDRQISKTFDATKLEGLL